MKSLLSILLLISGINSAHAYSLKERIKDINSISEITQSEADYILSKLELDNSLNSYEASVVWSRYYGARTVEQLEAELQQLEEEYTILKKEVIAENCYTKKALIEQWTSLIHRKSNNHAQRVFLTEALVGKYARLPVQRN